jgi:hypothetical protein
MREEEEARSGTSNGLTPSFYYGSTSERGKGGRNTPTTSDTSGIGFSFSSRRRRREEEEEEEEEYDEEEEERTTTTTTTTTTKLLDSNKTLTQFLASHTSEDNKSFEDILEKINKKRREKNAKLFDAKKIHSAMNVQRLSDGSEGARTKSGALALAEPGQNALFFRPDSALALSKNELANLGATTAPKETFARNTRFNSSNNSHVIEVNEVDEEELALFREQREKDESKRELFANHDAKFHAWSRQFHADNDLGCFRCNACAHFIIDWRRRRRRRYRCESGWRKRGGTKFVQIRARRRPRTRGEKTRKSQRSQAETAQASANANDDEWFERKRASFTSKVDAWTWQYR